MLDAPGVISCLTLVHLDKTMGSFFLLRQEFHKMVLCVGTSFESQTSNLRYARIVCSRPLMKIEMISALDKTSGILSG